MNQYALKLKYINWIKEAMKVNLTWKEWSEMYHKITIKENERENLNRRILWKPGCWAIREKNNYKYLYYRSEKGNYIIYTTNFFNDNKNRGGITKTGFFSSAGRTAIKGVSDKFKELYKVSLQKAFGYSPEAYIQYVPRQFYYQADNFKDRITRGVSSCDFSAHYPASACGRLPDYHTAKKIKGYVKPTPEYPFAFYEASGHCAEYGVFDTHEWLKSELVDVLFNPKMKNHKRIFANEYEETTILMKASEYQLTNVYEHFYQLRKEDEQAKLVMNASIGFFHKKNYNSYKLAHLAAIIIARANDKMLKLAYKINLKKILQICVDGCIYMGKNEYGTHEKKMGNLIQEYTFKAIKYKGSNNYIVAELNDYTQVVKFKHGACNARTDGKSIEEVEDINAIDKWIKIKPEELEGDYGEEEEEE